MSVCYSRKRAIEGRGRDSPTSTVDTISLGPNDCIVGKGKAAYSSEGNRKYMRLICESVAKYKTLKKNAHKIKFTKDIFDTIVKRGGRFLGLNSNGKFFEVPENQAIVKIGQALRHKRREIARLEDQGEKVPGEVSSGRPKKLSKRKATSGGRRTKKAKVAKDKTEDPFVPETSSGSAAVSDRSSYSRVEQGADFAQDAEPIHVGSDSVYAPSSVSQIDGPNMPYTCSTDSQPKASLVSTRSSSAVEPTGSSSVNTVSTRSSSANMVSTRSTSATDGDTYAPRDSKFAMETESPQKNLSNNLSTFFNIDGDDEFGVLNDDPLLHDEGSDDPLALEEGSDDPLALEEGSDDPLAHEDASDDPYLDTEVPEFSSQELEALSTYDGTVDLPTAQELIAENLFE